METWKISHLEVDSVTVTAESVSAALKIANEQFQKLNYDRSERIEIQQIKPDIRMRGGLTEEHREAFEKWLSEKEERR